MSNVERVRAFLASRLLPADLAWVECELARVDADARLARQLAARRAANTRAVKVAIKVLRAERRAKLAPPGRGGVV